MVKKIHLFPKFSKRDTTNCQFGSGAYSPPFIILLFNIPKKIPNFGKLLLIRGDAYLFNFTFKKTGLKAFKFLPLCRAQFLDFF